MTSLLHIQVVDHIKIVVLCRFDLDNYTRYTFQESIDHQTFLTPVCTTDDDLCIVIETFGDQYFEFLESVSASACSPLESACLYLATQAVQSNTNVSF